MDSDTKMSPTKMSGDMNGCSLDWNSYTSSVCKRLNCRRHNQGECWTVFFFLRFAPGPENIVSSDCCVGSLSVKDLAVRFRLRVSATWSVELTENSLVFVFMRLPPAAQTLCSRLRFFPRGWDDAARRKVKRACVSEGSVSSFTRRRASATLWRRLASSTYL